MSGHEDVLYGPVPRVGRGARTRFTTGRDLAAVAVIVAAVLVAGLVIWQRGDARATTSQTGPSSVPAAVPPASMPPSLAEVWRTHSAATPMPATVGPTVVAADGGEVVGLDPLTGQSRWRYARNRQLCTVAPAWNRVVAVYRKDNNCSEVTSLDPTTGARGPQRNGDAEVGTRLLSDGVHLTATGHTLLETWRSDLVRTDEYGAMPAPVNPGRQPRPGCTYGSVAVTSGRIAVVELCPGSPVDQLTLLKPNPKDWDAPEVIFSIALGGHGAQVVAVGSENVAVSLASPSRLFVYSGAGAQLTEAPLDVSTHDLTTDPAGGAVPTTLGADEVYWSTGSTTVALANSDFTPLWTVGGTIGPGTLFAGRLLLPVTEGLAVVDPASGARAGTLAVDRHGYRGPVQLGSLGPVVFEQRGGTLVALR